jgi:hypothetical protein
VPCNGEPCGWFRVSFVETSGCMRHQPRQLQH